MKYCVLSLILPTSNKAKPSKCRCAGEGLLKDVFESEGVPAPFLPPVRPPLPVPRATNFKCLLEKMPSPFHSRVVGEPSSGAFVHFVLLFSVSLGLH